MALQIVNRAGERPDGLDDASLPSDHAAEIASGAPAIPADLNDRAADIWEPLLVLADEPTANLDHAHGEPLMDLMGELSRERGVAFLVASHDPRLNDLAEQHGPGNIFWHAKQN